jgi:pyruvate dehydrogenase E2 component (dihydrolipoamide acetyltransferase)
MAYVVKMPKLGMDMDQGTVVEWFVEAGEAVTEGQVVAEIESEKTTGEITVREDGVVHEVLLAAGESTEPGGAVAVVGAPDEDVSGLLAEAGVEGDAGTEADATAGEAEATEEPAATAGGSGGGRSVAAQVDVVATPRARRQAEELAVDLAGVEGTGPQGAVSEADVEAAAEGAEGAATEAASASSTEAADSGAAEPATPERADPGGRVFASPRVRRLARELGVDIATVDGTGVGGAVTEPDVRGAAGTEPAGPAGQSEPTAAEAEVPGTRDEERPLGSMRRTIASRLGQSYREAVHVTVHRTAAADDLLAAAKAAQSGLDAPVSVNDVLLLAVSATLDAHPGFNATAEDEVHRLHAEHNLCVAVDVDAGLVAPVVRGVDRLSLSELVEKRRAVTERALAGEHTMNDLTGGTFTVSNLGVLGVESFDPVINPPQVAILGVDTIADAVVPGADGEPTVEKRIGFDLSFDHRFVDGADAARFVQTLVGHVEEPWPLVVAASAR